MSEQNPVGDLMKLCHIKCDHHNVLKMSTSTEMQAGWSCYASIK